MVKCRHSKMRKEEQMKYLIPKISAMKIGSLSMFLKLKTIMVSFGESNTLIHSVWRMKWIMPIQHSKQLTSTMMEQYQLENYHT